MLGSVTSCYGNRNNCTIHSSSSARVSGWVGSVLLRPNVRCGNTSVVDGGGDSSLLSPHVSIHLIERINDVHTCSNQGFFLGHDNGPGKFVPLPLICRNNSRICFLSCLYSGLLRCLSTSSPRPTQLCPATQQRTTALPLQYE